MEIEFYDLIVIGAGPAGEKGAITAASFRKKVCIVEKGHDVGGAVANTGTLPSKTLRETALALSGFKARRLYGVDLSLRREATLADYMNHERQVSASERGRIMRSLRGYKVDLYRGAARFEDPNTIRVSSGDGHTAEASPDILLRGEKVLIATGSSPLRPPEFRFEDDRIHDSDEILTLDRLPKTLAIIGAGVIGSEYACTFAALGTTVHVIDGRDMLLSFLDHEVSRSLTDAMERLGIEFHWGQKVANCEAPKSGQVVLTLTSGETLSTDGVLIAAGRSSNTASLNLVAAGVTPGERGLLKVNGHCQTEVPHIYAAGDVIGFPALASTGMEQARVAMCHAFDKGYKSVIEPLLPNGIYTIPEVSMVGETEETLKAKGIKFVVGKASYKQNARGEIIGDETGFLKLLFARDDLRLVGVHVIGEQATEIVHIGLMAMLTGSGVELFNRACFNYPTLGDLYKTAAYQAMLRISDLPSAPTGALPSAPAP
jgi:NAD(P) transhydrogenase